MYLYYIFKFFSPAARSTGAGTAHKSRAAQLFRIGPIRKKAIPPAKCRRGRRNRTSRRNRKRFILRNNRRTPQTEQVRTYRSQLRRSFVHRPSGTRFSRTGIAHARRIFSSPVRNRTFYIPPSQDKCRRFSVHSPGTLARSHDRPFPKSNISPSISPNTSATRTYRPQACPPSTTLPTIRSSWRSSFHSNTTFLSLTCFPLLIICKSVMYSSSIFP